MSSSAGAARARASARAAPSASRGRCKQRACRCAQARRRTLAAAGRCRWGLGSNRDSGWRNSAADARPVARLRRHEARLGRVSARLDPERYLPLALDLPGHGEASAQPGRSPSIVCRGSARAQPERFALCGYSLGGRIALHVALAAPQRVSRLVLVSTSAGIEDLPSAPSAAWPTPAWPTSSNAFPSSVHRALALPATVRRRAARGRCARARGSAPQRSASLAGSCAVSERDR